MEISLSETKWIINKAQTSKNPLFIWGPPGIGKSALVRQAAENYASKLNKVLVDWNRISDTHKRELNDDGPAEESTLCSGLKDIKGSLLDNVYIFADVRVSQMDPSDLRGLPNINGKNYVEWRPTLLFRVLSHSKCNGWLFFDELSLAPPSLQSAAYQIILDHCIGELALSDKVYVSAAGNRAEDKASVYELSMPLKNRFLHVTQLCPTLKEWEQWAADNDIDSRIIAFLNYKPDMMMADLNKLDKKAGNNAFPTPRSWAFCSSVINEIEVSTKSMSAKENIRFQRAAAAAVGEASATMLTSFVRLIAELDLDEIFKNPDKIKGMSADVTWALLSAVTERYKKDRKIFKNVFDIMNVLDKDFAACLLRMVSATEDKASFINRMTKSNDYMDIISRFHYIFDRNID